MNKRIFIISLAIILVLAVAILAYFKEPSDTKCAYGALGEQALCCENLHKNDPRIQCTGSWQYNSTSAQCSFICDISPVPNEPDKIFCTADVMQCPDGSYVARDPERNCSFKSCP